MAEVLRSPSLSPPPFSPFFSRGTRPASTRRRVPACRRRPNGAAVRAWPALWGEIFSALICAGWRCSDFPQGGRLVFAQTAGAVTHCGVTSLLAHKRYLPVCCHRYRTSLTHHRPIIIHTRRMRRSRVAEARGLA